MSSKSSPQIFIVLDEDVPLEGFTQLSNIIESTRSKIVELTKDIASNLSIGIGEFCNILYNGAKTKFEANPPSKFTVEFGVQINSETSIRIIKANAGAQIKVVAEWDTKKDK